MRDDILYKFGRDNDESTNDTMNSTEADEIVDEPVNDESINNEITLLIIINRFINDHINDDLHIKFAKQMNILLINSLLIRSVMNQLMAINLLQSKYEVLLLRESCTME